MMDATKTQLAVEVERRIHDALQASATDEASHIGVTMRGEVAELHGTVRGWAEHEDAGRAAAETPGVCKVDNQLALIVKGTISP
jgi:osmotically-inducible protein OsmY